MKVLLFLGLPFSVGVVVAVDFFTGVEVAGRGEVNLSLKSS